MPHIEQVSKEQLPNTYQYSLHAIPFQVILDLQQVPRDKMERESENLESRLYQNPTNLVNEDGQLPFYGPHRSLLPIRLDLL